MVDDQPILVSALLLLVMYLFGKVFSLAMVSVHLECFKPGKLIVVICL